MKACFFFIFFPSISDNFLDVWCHLTTRLSDCVHIFSSRFLVVVLISIEWIFCELSWLFNCVKFFFINFFRCFFHYCLPLLSSGLHRVFFPTLENFCDFCHILFFSFFCCPFVTGLFCLCLFFLALEMNDYVFGMPLCFVPGTQFIGGVNVYSWKLIIIDINDSHVYNTVLKHNFCTCSFNYDEDKCDCLNIVASMLIKRDVHKAVAYFKDDFIFENPTKVKVIVGGWSTEFDVSIYRHDASPHCLCDNFSQYIQVNWDQLVGEDGSASSDSYDRVLYELFHSEDGPEELRQRSIHPPSPESSPEYMFYPLDKPKKPKKPKDGSFSEYGSFGFGSS